MYFVTAEHVTIKMYLVTKVRGIRLWVSNPVTPNVRTKSWDSFLLVVFCNNVVPILIMRLSLTVKTLCRLH